MLNQKLMGAGGAAEKTYIEDVFSTYLYTGTGAAQTINNGIDLAGKGGMVWTKSRNAVNTVWHNIADTARGTNSFIFSNATDAALTETGSLTSFNSNGYTLGSAYRLNSSADNFVSWTFRKAPKFFDVVTYTGNGVAGRTISHSLGQAPGMIMVKCTSASTTNWWVYHKDLGISNSWSFDLKLNTTASKESWQVFGTPSQQTASYFTLGSLAGVPEEFNGSGKTYVAYLFAHDTTTDGLIQCGSFTTNASGDATVSLGWEPQYLIVKSSSGTGNWQIIDNMRGMALTSGAALRANLTNAEASVIYARPNATGFFYNEASSTTYIYMAIRRGPMKTPTDGTKVFSPNAINAVQGTKVTTGFPLDMQLMGYRSGTTGLLAFNFMALDRLRGVSTVSTTVSSPYLLTATTAAEVSTRTNTQEWDNTGFDIPNNYDSESDIFWNFRRAPGFFDVVCYTGTGVARTVNHNLGVTPELMIIKNRAAVTSWGVYHSAIGATGGLYLNTTAAAITNSGFWNNTSPTSTTFTVSTQPFVSGSGNGLVAYLFASCHGVSKVFSFTGNGSSQTINCGFTTGARLVLIKRTDSTGDWYVWDTARGIVAGNDPHLSLNSTAAEVTTNDTIDPDSTGFIVNQVSATNVNVNGASYIGLAIA